MAGAGMPNPQGAAGSAVAELRHAVLAAANAVSDARASPVASPRRTSLCLIRLLWSAFPPATLFCPAATCPFFSPVLHSPSATTTAPPEAMATLNRALSDYIDFVRAIADSPTDALRAKVEAELGAKALQLRAVPSAGDSETRRNVPVAGDRIVTDHVTSTVIDVGGRRGRQAAPAEGRA